MATVQYDDILLNIRSAMSSDGIDKAISNLKAIKGVFPIEGLSESASDMQAFANAINSINSDTLKTISSMKRRLKGITGGLTINQQLPSPAVDEATKTDVGAPDVGELAKNADKAKDALDKADKSANNLSKDLEKSKKESTSLWDKLKKIAQYRMLRAVISGMANAMKEGVGNLEAWDRRVGNTGFAEAMDRARESLLVLKNSLAVASAPFIEVLISGLQKVAQLVMFVANQFSRLMAILGGKPTYRAVKWADYTANAVKATTGAVKNAGKEFERQLMKFDEINNITEKNGSGGSSGYGNSGFFNYDDMFEEREVGELGKVGKLLDEIGSKIRSWNADFLTANQRIDETSDRFNKFFKIDKIVDKVQKAMARYNQELKTYGSNIDETSDKFNKFFHLDQIAEKIRQAYVTVGDIVVGSFQKMIIYSQSAKDIALAYAEALVKGMQLAFETLKVFLAGGDWKTYWKQGMDQIKSDLDTKVTGAIQNAKDNLDKTFNKKYALQFDTGALVTLKSDLQQTFDRKYWLQVSISENVTRNVQEVVQSRTKSNMWYANYATGGFPTQGQMFIAREAGPELVGTIGSQTAVVNNSDIVASVSQGVAQAVASVLGGGQQVNVTLEGDAKNLFKVVQREGRAYSARTGQPALA